MRWVKHCTLQKAVNKMDIVVTTYSSYYSYTHRSFKHVENCIALQLPYYFSTPFESQSSWKVVNTVSKYLCLSPAETTPMKLSPAISTKCQGHRGPPQLDTMPSIARGHLTSLLAFHPDNPSHFLQSFWSPLSFGFSPWLVHPHLLYLKMLKLPRAESSNIMSFYPPDGFKCHLYVDNSPIYISILDFSLEFQNFIYSCQLKLFIWVSDILTWPKTTILLD